MTWTPVTPAAPAWAPTPASTGTLTLALDADAAPDASVALSNALQAGAMLGAISLKFTFDDWSEATAGTAAWVPA